MPSHEFDERPLVVVWEMTRACRLACRHCRAEARRTGDAGELRGGAVERLLDQVAEAGPQVLILTGGDPARRRDLLWVVREAAGRGLRVALSPSATPDLLALDFEGLKQAGVWKASLSLDADCRDEHDAFRGVSRAWDWTMQAFAAFRVAGIPVQVNTTITAANIGSFDRLAEVMRRLAPAGWTIFLVVPTGRASHEELPTPQQVEDFFVKLCEFSRTVDFEIRTTEGQHYRRVLRQHHASSRLLPATNGAKGFVFVSHTGDVCPSGFLPVVGGNVTSQKLLDIYRDAPAFRQLRDPGLLKGKCGRCPFKDLCGGSRARAYALTGDLFAEEPLCAYQP